MAENWDVEYYLSPESSCAEVVSDEAFNHYRTLFNIEKSDKDLNIRKQLYPTEKYREKNIEKISGLLTQGGSLEVYDEEERKFIRIEVVEKDLQIELHSKN